MGKDVVESEFRPRSSVCRRQGADLRPAVMKSHMLAHDPSAIGSEVSADWHPWPFPETSPGRTDDKLATDFSRYWEVLALRGRASRTTLACASNCRRPWCTADALPHFLSLVASRLSSLARGGPYALNVNQGSRPGCGRGRSRSSSSFVLGMTHHSLLFFRVS